MVIVFNKIQRHNSIALTSHCTVKTAEHTVRQRDRALIAVFCGRGERYVLKHLARVQGEGRRRRISAG
jgi:hypothetical protein